MARRMKKPSERYARVVVTLPPETLDLLDKLAESPTFRGNRSLAVRWAVEVAAQVLGHPDVASKALSESSEGLKTYINSTTGAEYQPTPYVWDQEKVS